MSRTAPGRRPRLGVLVSGNGSNLQAILEAQRAGVLEVDVAVVISNRPGVRALSRAAAAGVPSLVVDHRERPSREAFDAELLGALREHEVEWVVLAGFMRLLGPGFLGAYRNRVINIHPALLPSFRGLHGARQALEYGVRVTGCTVHLVDHGVDTGAILDQSAVRVYPGDTVDSLEQRIHAAEHQLYVSVLQRIARGELLIESDTAGQPIIRGAGGRG